MKRTKYLLAVVLVGSVATFGGCNLIEKIAESDQGKALVEDIKDKAPDIAEDLLGAAAVLIPSPWNFLVPILSSLVGGLFGRKDNGK